MLRHLLNHFFLLVACIVLAHCNFGENETICNTGNGARIITDCPKKEANHEIEEHFS